MSLFHTLENRDGFQERERELKGVFTLRLRKLFRLKICCWRGGEFFRGKRKRDDVALFSLHLMDEIIALHNDLKAKTYRHGSYHAFKVNDP